MTLKQYLILMSLATAVSWLAWGFVLWNVNPIKTDSAGLSIFYVSLFMALVGTFCVTGLGARHRAYQNDVAAAIAHVRQTLLQGIIFGATAVFLLFLAARDLVSLWVVLLIALVVAGIEGALLTARQRNNALYVK